MFQLRGYQKEAVEKVLKYFRKKKEPAVVVLPTGAGKSLVIAELARMAKGRVLVLAHVKELVEQNHEKYQSYGQKAGIFSASLQKKETEQKAIFGSIQSVARASSSFFENFSLLIIDECHRVAEEGSTQYQEVIRKLKEANPELCILGLTATPYRLGLGWIYEYSESGEIKTQRERFFKRCVYEMPLSFMVKERYLVTPVKINIPVTSYNFSELTQNQDGYFSFSEIEEIIKSQRQLTPLIVRNIVDITERYSRQGVMIFCCSVKHAEDIKRYLPEDQVEMVIGDTSLPERDQIIDDFKKKKFKYLVNVSVLTTGFDAPHVDVIAILRPTESDSLFQQIIGRGLRLCDGKKDCYVLDYTGMQHDIYAPEVGERRPSKEAVPVQVVCPKCEFVNQFWGHPNEDGYVLEHFGRKCKGATHDLETLEIHPCGYRFRFKLCAACGAENDLTAKECEKCKESLTDAEAKIKQARLSKNAHVFTPDQVTFEERIDKRNNPYLEVRYYDYDSNYVSEVHFFNNPSAIKKFNINFLRFHLRCPELAVELRSPSEVIKYQSLYRLPSFVIARKQDRFWRITEKVFSEELRPE